jgi:PAS domain S-box-containing protein
MEHSARRLKMAVLIMPALVAVIFIVFEVIAELRGGMLAAEVLLIELPSLLVIAGLSLFALQRWRDLNIVNHRLQEHLERQKSSHHTLERHLMQLQTLNEVSWVISSTLELNQILNMAARLVTTALDATSCYIADWHEESKTSTVIAEFYGAQASEKERVSDLGKTYHITEDFDDDLQWLYSSKPSIVHLTDPKVSEKERKHLEAYDGKSVLVMPLHVAGKPYGCLEIWESRYVREFSEEEIDLVNAIGKQLSIAISNARLYAALKESQERYKALFENTADAVLVHRQGRLVEANASFEQLFGYERGETIGKSIFELLPEDEHQRIRAETTAMEQGVIKARGLRKDGTTFEMELHIRKITHQGEEVRIVSVHNLTRRRQIEEQELALKLEQERANLLQRFIESISHDLRTPLSIMNTSIYLLRRNPNSPKYEQYLERLDMQVQRISRLVEDALMLSQLDESQHLQLDAKNPRSLLETVLVNFQRPAQEKSIQLTLDVEDGLPRVRAYDVELARAFAHLIQNALHYTPAGGAVTLSSYRQGDGVLFQVRDTGTGISKEDLPYIFQRFYRADRARSTDKGGAGLGLAIVKTIIERHSGTIYVDSTLGAGTTVNIWLPAAEAPVDG